MKVANGVFYDTLRHAFPYATNCSSRWNEDHPIEIIRIDLWKCLTKYGGDKFPPGILGVIYSFFMGDFLNSEDENPMFLCHVNGVMTVEFDGRYDWGDVYGYGGGGGFGGRDDEAWIDPSVRNEKMRNEMKEHVDGCDLLLSKSYANVVRSRRY